MNLKIPTHPNPHLDEIVGRWLLCPVVEEFFSDGNVPEIGHGGSIFDEHLTNGGCRMKGECAATLVAKHIGVSEDHRLGELLKFTLQTDECPPQHPFDLASAVLVSRRRCIERGESSETYEKWVRIALDAYWQTVEDAQMSDEVREVLAKARSFGDLNFMEILASIGLISGMGDQSEKLWNLARHSTNGGGHKHPFDLTAMTRLIASRMGYDVAHTWFVEAATVVRDEQLAFNEALKEVRQSFRRTDVQAGRGNLSIASGQSGNPQVAKAARSLGAAFVVHKLLSGQILISSDNRKVSQELMDKIAERVMVQELGNPDDVWYYHRPARMLLNGGASAPDKPPTNQSLQQIVEIIKKTIQDFFA